MCKANSLLTVLLLWPPKHLPLIQSLHVHWTQPSHSLVDFGLFAVFCGLVLVLVLFDGGFFWATSNRSTEASVLGLTPDGNRDCTLPGIKLQPLVCFLALHQHFLYSNNIYLRSSWLWNDAMLSVAHKNKIKYGVRVCSFCEF